MPRLPRAVAGSWRRIRPQSMRTVYRTRPESNIGPTGVALPRYKETATHGPTPSDNMIKVDCDRGWGREHGPNAR